MHPIGRNRLGMAFTIVLIAMFVGAVLPTAHTVIAMPRAITMAQAAAAAPITVPDDCSTYPEKRVYLESQAWWTTTPGKHGTDNGHLHTGTCFPYAQQIRGTIGFDVRLIMHDNPGKLVSIAMQVFGDYGAVIVAKKSFTPPLNCAQTCTFRVHLDADTTRVPADGRQEFRIRPKVEEPDGNAMIGSTSYPVYLTNGRPHNDYRGSDLLQGKGWYSGADYAKAQLASGFPFTLVHATWKPLIKCESSGPPVHDCLVAIDPDFHSGNPGRTILSVDGPYSGLVAIDTTRLSNGVHRFFLRTEAADPRGSSNGGVLVFYFTVQN